MGWAGVCCKNISHDGCIMVIGDKPLLYILGISPQEQDLFSYSMNLLAGFESFESTVT